MTNNLFENPPVSYPATSPDDESIIWNYSKSVKILVLIGFICLTLFLVLLLVSLKMVFSQTKNEQPSKPQGLHIDPSLTSTNKVIDNHTTVSICDIPFNNATWDKYGTIFVNRMGQCGSNDTLLCRPLDLFLDNVNDNLYVVDTNNNRIQKYSLTQPFPSGQAASGITVARQGLIAPSSIYVDTQTEDMYILDYNKRKIDDLHQPAAYRVHLWPKNASIGQIIIEELGEYGFRFNSHIVLDKQMNIYVETRFHIRKWFASTNYASVITAAGNGQLGKPLPDQLYDPHGLYIDDDLTMYIVDWNNQRIQKWPANASQGTTLTSNLLYPYGITRDCHGNIYYVDVYEHAVYQFNVTTNQTITVIGNDADAQDQQAISLFSPYAMKFDKFGNMFVIDSEYSRIKKFSIL